MPRPRLDSRARAALRSAARRAGLEAPLEKAWQQIDPTARRDAVDRRNLRLLLAFTLQEDASCVDVGAHRGDVLREILRVAPRGRHVAFEPLPAQAAELAREFPQVDVRNAAVSDTAGVQTFAHVVGEPEQSGLKARHWAQEGVVESLEVRVERLDDALPEGFVPRLIKIDVEGAERQVMEGGMETITRHRPLVLFEHGLGGSDHYSTRPEHVYELLVRQAGLRIFDLAGDGPYSAARFDEVFTEPIWNFVAVP